MALLKVGSKAPVFVTHLEFVGTECQIFCQVGDVGGQADTLAERVHESVENGLASPISGCNVGDLCLALFNEDGSWYRGKVLQNLGHSLKVYFIDYGNTETVKMNDIRSAPDYVLAIPALSTKCIVSDCTPLSGIWVDEEKKKIETMLHSGEFICEIMESDVNTEVYRVKLYSNDASNTPIFVRPAPSSSLSIKSQNLKVGQDYEVYVSYVESSRKFWVQLKSHENDLNSLMSDISACFAEDLPSTGDIVNPTEGQVCAACFSDDGAFYRSIVQNIQGSNCTVFFLDYGNNEEKRTSELFTLPQALCQLPVQAVQCSYKVDSQAIDDKLHDLAEDEGPSVLKVLSGNTKTGYVVEINSIEQILNVPKETQQFSQAKSASKLWQSYSSVVMQADGIYDVCLSHIDHPGQFYVQLLANASNLDKLMQAIDEVAHNYDKLTNLYQGYQCLAKFSDGSWYRGEVVTAEVGKTVVAAVDFGFVEVVQPSQLRNTDPNFKLQPAQAVKCTLDLNKTAHSMWTAAEIDKFKGLSEKNTLVAKVSLKKGCIHQVDLYETENGVERHINTEINNKSTVNPSRAASQIQAKPQPVSAPPAVVLSPPEVSVGSKYKLCFTAVKSLYIYGQLTSTSVEKVAKLQTDLNMFFEKKSGEALLKAEVGSVCCTQYVDGGWYRGIVTSVAGGKAEVAFVDFGDSVMKSVNDLKILPPSLCSLPQQCILCKIVNLPSTVGSSGLEKLINKRVEVKLNGKEDGVYPTYGTEITDRQILEQYQEPQGSRPAVFKGASSRTFGRPQKDETSSVQREMKGRKSSGNAYTQQEVVVNSTQEVMVTYVKSPNNFQVVLEKMTASLDYVMDQLHEYYDKLPPGSNKLVNPTLGQACVAQFTDDKGWYRALVTGLMADGQAEVMYVDYGNNEYTEKDALKEIQQQFMSLPAQAVQCRLSGVSSSQGFWSPEHIVQFTEMVEEQSFMATFKAELHEQGQTMYKVELVDKKGNNINQKFGTMTGTTCSEEDSGPCSRSVSAGKFGQSIKVTVAGGEEDSNWEDGGNSGFGGKARSFGSGRQQSGGSSGFGSRSSGFGNKQSSGGRDGGWDDNDTGGSSSGFGSKKPFGSSGGDGFGSNGGGGSGFGSSGRGGGGFGSGGGGFGSSSGGGGFGSSSGGGFGKSSGFGSSAGGGGSKDCFKCGESGHFSRECPSAAKGGGRDCYKCGESGHMARDCTNPPKGGGGGRDCFKCGESGHMARDCTNPPKAGGGGGGRDCYKCGESGHMARDCTNPPKAGGGGGGRDCYKCGESGHMARDCTNPPKAGGGGGGRDCYKCGESGHMARDCTNPPKDGAGPRKGFGGGSDRSSGGFGNKGGGFGARSENTSENWGDSSSKTSSSGGFGARGGFGGKGSDDSSRGGGFGGAPGSSGGGFGSRSGGFGSKSSEKEWGSGDSTTKKTDVGGGDDWGAEESSVTNQVPSPAGDGSSNSKVAQGTELSSLILDTKEPVDVYVVYITNPEQFWCQVMKNCPSLEKLMEDMNTFYNGVSESEFRLGTPEIGMPCAAKFSEDNMWYRAIVLTPSQSNVEVQFVDYGNTETVAIDKLKQLKPEFMTLKIQGIKCRLDDIISIDKTWTQKSIEDFEDMTQDKHLVAKVITRSSDLTHVLDLENLDEKMNIAEAMSEKGHCKLRSFRTSPVKQQIVKNPYPLACIQAGQEIDVYVSWIENPAMFWIQPVSKENELTEFVEKVQELYTSGAGTGMNVDSIIMGQAVVAQFSEDEAWYRGYIENVSAGQLKVRFTDYGNSDVVGKEAIRGLSDELLKESSYAAQCKLVGVRPLQAGQWTADARDIMDGLVKDEVVKCKVVDISNGCASVELVSKELDVAQELIQTAVVRGIKESSPNVKAGSSKSSVGILTYSNEMLLSVGTTEGVFISYTDSVASFWCQPARSAVQLEDLMAQLEVHCQSGTGIQDFPMDMACAAKFSEDDVWYRAKVTAAYPDTVEVLFVDYGNTEKVSKTDVCELTEELIQLPPQAVECELVNASKASNQLTAQFKELIGEEEVQATVVDILDNSAVVCLTLPSGKDIGEELGLTEPGSTTPVPAKPASTVSKSGSNVLSYPKTVMPCEPTMVFVTQIIDAGEFYVQQADKEKQLNDLMADLSDFCQSAEAELISAPQVEQACCAKFADDGCWYRAKIVEITGKNCTVEFVDYGNSEKTTIDEIRSITERLVQAAPFVLKCSLEGIVPVNGKWCEESIKKFEDLAVGKDLLCEVVKGSEVIIKCGTTDMAEALVESGLAKMVEGSVRTIAKKQVKPLVYKKETFPEQPVDVYVSHVNSPGDFYVQQVDLEEKLNQLMEKLVQFYESSGDGLMMDSVSNGQAVCAKYSEDEAWYRAEVTCIEGAKINVLFIDYGNMEETSLANIRELKEEFMAATPFAVRCQLYKVKPEGDWSEESGVFFETQTSEKVLQCEFVAGNNVCLKLDGTDVVDSLVEKGYCRKITEQVSPSKQKGQFTPQSVPADSVSCYVSHVDESGSLYVQLACEEDTLNAEVEKVQTLHSNKPLDLEAVKKGDLVCAKFSEDESWYRAVVISTRDNLVKVRFVDYGNCDEVQQASDLRALPEDHQVTPPLAYACTLHGLKKLKSSQIDLLKDVTADKELTVTFITTAPEYEIQLEDENQQDIGQQIVNDAESQPGEVPEEQTENKVTDSKGEDVSSNTEGKDVPTNTDVENISKDTEGDDVTKNKDDSSTNKIDESVPTDGDNDIVSDADNVPENTEDDVVVPDINMDAITDKVCDLNSETLTIGQRLNVLVGHSESPSKFWVQKESENKKLDSLLNTMFDFYNVCEDERLAVESVEKDMLVAALFDEDESWYRARVVSCENKEQVKVTFIDHGNTEVIPRKSLRKLPTQFASLPIQGIECCLGGVEPCEKVWNDEVKEVFAELTADKVLILDVGDVDEEGVFKVQLLDMGMSVGDQLIQRNIGVNMATPVAVSTKVKQVFTPDTNDNVITRLYSAKSSKTLGQYGYLLRDLCEDDPTISTHNVLVTSITSLDEFWCRLQDNSYEFYQDKLQESYSDNREQLVDICKGVKCVVYVNGKDYLRGTVVDESDDGVNVKLVDVGDNVIVPQSSVFKLKCECDTYPQLAFCCSFPGLIAIGTDTQNVQKVFKDTVLELSDQTELPASAKATIVIVRETDGKILVELTIDRKDIAESLVGKGVAEFDKTVDTSVLDDQIDVSENFGAFKNVHLDVDTDYDSVLIDSSDLNRLVFHTVDGISAMKEIEKAISETVADDDTSEKGDNLTEGPCLAKCAVDGKWKRANIRSSCQKSEGEEVSQTCKVFLVDYGSTFELPATNIRPIPDTLMKLPAQAVICHLDEIEPIDEDWTDECYEFIAEHYMDEDSKLVLYVNNYRKGLHDVFVSSRDEGEKSINHMLIELGMAAPIIGSQIEMSILADTAETSFHELSMTRQDSYGDSSDLGETSYEPDSSYLAESSFVTERDTSCITESENDTSCLTEGDTSQFTEGDTSQFTEGDTSQFTEVDTSHFTEGDTSHFMEGDTSHFTEGDTSQFTEGDTSQFTEGDTTDSSVHTLDGTHWVCDECSSKNFAEDSMIECQNCHNVKKETGDGQFVADAKKTDPPISDVGEGESEKEEYEDAHEADNASDLKTSPELSQSTADNDSFYDADEDRKQE